MTLLNINLMRLTGVLFAAGVVLLAYCVKEDIRYYVIHLIAGEGELFAAETPPIGTSQRIFDLGIVDANGDGRLDLFTSNHNHRQALLLSDARGGHQDVLTKWGLDQNRNFPGLEQSFTAPLMQRPGLYVYRLGETLTLRAVGLEELGPITGTIKRLGRVRVEKKEGFSLRKQKVAVPDSPISQTIINFKATGDGQLELSPKYWGVPIYVEVDPTFPLSSIFVGSQKASPLGHVFTPHLQDRHGHAWADIDADGRLDVYISRGGVGGRIRKLPAVLQQDIRDELLVTGKMPGFADVTIEKGMEKKACSGRHVEWVDFDGDGKLDLFVNCQNRGRSQGIFPKQLWRGLADGSFQDVAMAVGLGLPDSEFIDFVWIDVDDDSDRDLLTAEDKGFFLYLNEAGRYSSNFLFKPEFVRADVARLKSKTHNYWRFDGKLTVADFDADGDLDVFSSSKRGNVLLVSDSNSFMAVDPASRGLPSRSLNAVWVDYDNDGLPDLHTVPDGLFRQSRTGQFEATNLLAMTAQLYQAAIVHWYDLDNDGRRDVLVALNENPDLWHWWQRFFRTEDDRHAWTLHTWRNLELGNHWLQIQVSGPEGNRQAIGARVTVSTPHGTQVQEVGGNDSSFFSQGHYRLYFGLGPAAQADRITVRWSNGQAMELKNVAADQLLRIGPSQSND